MDWFAQRIRRRDTVGRWARKYTFYMVGFLLLKFLLRLCEMKWPGTVGAIAMVKPFLQERWILLLIGFVLWSVYGILCVYADLFNRENLYQSLLLEYYIDKEVWPYVNHGVAFGNCITLALFPEISQYADPGNVMWGWGNNGTILTPDIGNSFRAETPLYLVSKPAVFSEQITMDLKLATKDQLNAMERAKGKKLVQLDELEDKKRKELLFQCIRGGEIDFPAQLHVECLVFTADGKLIIPPKNGSDKNSITWSFPTKAYMTKGDFCNCLLAEFQKGILGKDVTVDKWGIQALFLDCHNGNAGLSMVLRLKETAEELGNGYSCVLADSIDDVVGLMADISIDKIGRYCLLIDVYAQIDQFEFSRKLCARNKRKTLKALLARAWRNGCGSDDGTRGLSKVGIPAKAELEGNSLFVRHPFVERFKNFFLSIFQRLKKWFHPRIKGIVFAYCLFLLENRSDQVVVKIPRKLCEVWKAVKVADLNGLWELIKKGFWYCISADFLPLSVLCALLVLWFVVWRIPWRPRNFRWLNKADSLMGNRNIIGVEDFRGYGFSSAHFRVTGTEHPFPGRRRCRHCVIPEICNPSSDDRIKYLLVDYNLSPNGIECVLDQCRFSDTQAVQQMIKSHNTGELGRHEEKYEQQFYEYSKAMEALVKQQGTLQNRRKIPPHSLCAHTLIITKDGYIVVMERSSQVSCFASCLSVSTEEQMSVLDVYNDDVRLRSWVERMCEEELGLTKRNSGSDSIGDIRLMSVFQEEDIMNVSLALVLWLNVKSKQLQAIIRHYPRKDYEGTFVFLKWEELYNWYVHTIITKEKTPSGDYVFHPTSIYRMYWGAIASLRFDIARRILHLSEFARRESFDCGGDIPVRDWKIK